ncbi:ABC-2 family transporter protein [filamentous cyanobacterium LEGE 11480]|uniref:ABC-2 family transporter protein n=1 Tax=Romeriopsis navalis LEGE 11480 TaxID=2777977 RepID=A0A928VPC8_9CYAN|nr:ABC-2 family transporter protein [Romeriopsis navalis]MBE9029669.1 ABC-2 family transporter protein [Romeriopsis navalis LEGE 11480]
MQRNLQRYFKLIHLFWSTSIAAEMEYRLNFVIATITSLGYQIGSLFTLSLFYQSDTGFPGWTIYESMVVLGTFTILQGFSATFLAPNLNQIVKQVEQGTLDFVLLKPVSSQFWLSTHRFSPWGIPDFLFGGGIIAYASYKVTQELGTDASRLPLSYLQSLVPLGFGFIILYSLWFILGATSIWFTKIYNVTEVLRGLLQAGRNPIAAYPPAYRFFFQFVVPVIFLTTTPAETLLNRASSGWLLGSGLLAIGLLAFSNWFWRFALRSYTSASS